MAARKQFLASAFGHHRHLRIRCERCDYEVKMTADVAIRRFGPGATPYSIKQRSRCSVCNKTDRIEVGF